MSVSHRLPVLAGLAAVLGLLPLAAGAQPGGGPPPAKVVLGDVRDEQVEQWREVTGSLRALQRSTVAAEVEGRAIDVPVREGEAVAAGGLLARQDATLLRLAADSAAAELGARRAAVADAQAVLEKAERDLPRARRLYESEQAVSEQVYDDAGTDLARARAGLERARAEQTRAEAELARARERLEDAAIRAPFAGTVVLRHAEAGEWLRVGDPVAELVSAERLEAWLDVPERYLQRLRALDDRVQLRLPAIGQVVQAPVTAVVPQADELARTLKVRVAVPDASHLAPGMSVIGLVPTGVRESSLTVPEDAVLRDDAGEFVYFDGGGQAVVARVETLFAVGDRVALRSSSLRPGMKVVVEGHQRLFPGQPLQAMGSATSGS